MNKIKATKAIRIARLNNSEMVLIISLIAKTTIGIAIEMQVKIATILMINTKMSFKVCFIFYVNNFSKKNSFFQRRK